MWLALLLLMGCPGTDNAPESPPVLPDVPVPPEVPAPAPGGQGEGAAVKPSDKAQ